MRQSQEIALAEQYQARAEATMELLLTHIEADFVGPLPLRAGLSDQMTAADINTYLWLWIQMDNHYFQYQRGFLDEESWQAQLTNVIELYNACPTRFVWDWRKAGLARRR